MVAPTPDAPIPTGWPLRKDGTVGCETCHLAGHGPRDPDNPRFLRGAPHRQRNAVCFHCHRADRWQGRNLHADLAQGRGCDTCHEGPATAAQHTAGSAGALLAEPNFLCLPCHPAPPHPASSAHTVRPRQKGFLTIDQGRAPLTLGKVTCHSCHDSHGTDRKTFFLRADGGRAVCGNCHPY